MPMGSIDRYVFRTILGAFVLILFSLTAVIWITHILRRIDIITNQGSYKLAGVLAATAVSIVLAVIGELIFAGLQRLLVPKGLTISAGRRGRGPAETAVVPETAAG